MAIASYKPVVQLPVEPEIPKAEPNNYKSIIYDDNNKPLHTLIAYIEGAPWYVDYYAQVLSKHNDLREVDTGQPNVYQQYHKINGLEIRVQSDLQTSYDSDTGITSTSGSGALYPFIIPNKADYFITNAGSARKGIFKVDSVERKTFNRDSVFEITYSMVGYIETHKEIFDDLESKAIRQYYFSKDRLVEGLQPILKEEDYQNISSLKEHYETLVDYYFHTFFNRKYMSLPVPGQGMAIFDAYLVNYVLKIVEFDSHPNIMHIKQVPTDHNRFISQPQFWGCMYSKDYPGLYYAHQKMVLAGKGSFSGNGWIEGFRFSNMDYLVFPKSPDLSLDVGCMEDNYCLVLGGLWSTENVHGNPAEMLTETFVSDGRTYQLYPRILSDDYYVLSKAFYNNTQCQTVLEILVKDYMSKKTINLKMLLALLDKYRNLARLEQFYYGPILLTLVKEADRSQYT